MRNSHLMVVHHRRQVIRREQVRLQKDRIRRKRRMSVFQLAKDQVNPGRARWKVSSLEASLSRDGGEEGWKCARSA